MAIVLRCFRKGSRFRRLLHDQSVEFDGDEFVSMQRVSINGLYDVLNGQVLAVYARDQQIFIVIGSASLSLAELGAEVRYEDVDGSKKLSLLQSSKLIGSLTYQVPIDDELMDQPFFSVDSSDLDIGHLIHQLAVSKSRQRDMIQVWSGGPPSFS
jgi:hypothetical protein